MPQGSTEGAALAKGPDQGGGTPESASELSVRVIKMLLLEFQRRFGRARLIEVFQRERLPLSIDYLERPENFVSWAFVERLQDLLRDESGDPDFVRKAAALTASPEALGFAYYLLKAFGTPKQMFEKVVELGPTFNRVGSFRIEESAPNHILLSHQNRVLQRDRTFCEGRMAQFAALPTIWGAPPANVTELACQVTGAEACLYDIRWAETVRTWRKYVGGGVGLLLAVLLWLAADPGPLALLLPITGFLFGSWRDSFAELGLKDEQLLTQSQGMTVSMADLQRRHEELNRINQELESRVASRTQDLTEANQKLEVALAAQRDLDRQKTEFFDNVSHELRTPLTIILLSLESLLMRDAQQVPPPVREHLQAMDRSATKLIRLINNLLDLAKMEAGKRRLAYQPVEMYSYLKSLLSPFRVIAQEKKLALDLEGSALSPIVVDPEMMDVVFQNLVGNALKFTSKGKVSVEIAETATHCQVTVRDTGPGMAPADLAVIFNRFAQADSSGLRRFGGTGIGLALVKETVELHGGTIEVSSELGVGAAFKVSLPKGEAHIREDLRERRQIEMPVRRDRRGVGDVLSGLRPQMGNVATLTKDASSDAEGGTGGPAASAFTRKILVVEDDTEIRRYITAMFRDDYLVIEAKDGEEGLAKAREENPDVIVSDVMMPVMSGLQFVEALRSSAELADTPVILLTARHELESRVTGLSAGANDYIAKPFSPRELIARVESQLRISEAAVRAAENERLAMMGLLSSGFAHEVRNPLNGLLNALKPLRDVLKRGVDPQSAETFVQIIEDCGERVRSLGESLLSFAQPTMHQELVDVPACLEATLKVLEWKIPENVSVKRSFDCIEKIRGEQSSLNMLWLNLIDNALQAMAGGGELRLSTRRVDEDLVVTITDTGQGIPKDIQDRIFEPFFSTRIAGRGTGLGLALCRRIVLKHRGQLRLSSDEAQGTTFEVRLPLLSRPADPSGVEPVKPS